MNINADTGKTQSYARYLNNRLVIHELREGGSCSATMLARRLNLSNAALSAIIDELKSKRYIREVKHEGNFSVGRRPVYWSVNADYGCVAVIGLCDHLARVAVSDMNMNITDSYETRVEKYDADMLQELASALQDILSREKYKYMPLLRIEFSLPGRVNELSDELMLSPQFDRSIFSERHFIDHMFSRIFSVPVGMSNDINLGAIAEMNRGLLKNVRNGMLVHIDEGIGGALVLDGKLYTGARGFAGEIGLMHTTYHGEKMLLDDVVSMRVVLGKLSQMNGGSLDVRAAAGFAARNAAARQYVLETAACLGEVLNGIVDLLDITRIVISGGVTCFGKEYIDEINGKVSRSLTGAKVFTTKLDGDGSIIGAVHKAVETSTDEICK